MSMTVPKSTVDALFAHLATVQLDADAAMGAYLNDPSEVTEVTARAMLVNLAASFQRCTDAAARLSPAFDEATAFREIVEGEPALQALLSDLFPSK